jgi:hypothetical protein
MSSHDGTSPAPPLAPGDPPPGRGPHSSCPSPHHQGHPLLIVSVSTAVGCHSTTVHLTGGSCRHPGSSCSPGHPAPQWQTACSCCKVSQMDQQPWWAPKQGTGCSRQAATGTGHHPPAGSSSGWTEPQKRCTTVLMGAGLLEDDAQTMVVVMLMLSVWSSCCSCCSSAAGVRDLRVVRSERTPAGPHQLVRKVLSVQQSAQSVLQAALMRPVSRQAAPCCCH